MIMRLLLCLALSLPFLGSPLASAAEQPVAEKKPVKEEISLDDLTVVPGERVGPIEKGMTLFGLKTLFGGGAVKAADLDVGEGDTEPGARLFEGTDKELEILFNQEGDEREIVSIRIRSKAWKSKQGLRIGLPMEEVEKINGKPFAIWGFSWDFGGFASFEGGGALQGGVVLRFGIKGDPHESIVGDQLIPTTHKRLRAARPEILEMSVVFSD